MEVQRSLVLNLDIRWRRVVTFALWPLYRQGKTRPCPFCRILEVAWDSLEKRKIFCLCRESNHDFSAVHPVAWSLCQIRYPLSLCRSVCYVSFAEIHHASQIVHVCVCVFVSMWTHESPIHKVYTLRLSLKAVFFNSIFALFALPSMLPA